MTDDPVIRAMLAASAGDLASGERLLTDYIVDIKSGFLAATMLCASVRPRSGGGEFPIVVNTPEASLPLDAWAGRWGAIIEGPVSEEALGFACAFVAAQANNDSYGKKALCEQLWEASASLRSAVFLTLLKVAATQVPTD